MEDEGLLKWTVIVLTCQHKDSVYAFQRGEFTHRMTLYVCF